MEVSWVIQAESEGVGILRDQHGAMVFAYTIPLGHGSNNQAEIQAVTSGIQWCLQHSYNHIYWR